jgi:adenosylcobinamide-GDP ribazoletransferase
MFTKIPMPQINWEKANMRYALAAFPLIGIVNGLVLLAWYWIAERFGFSATLYAAGLTLLPVLLTGGIHLDGYCDTIDALSSHAAPERKREILKDPNAGAFAVIYLGVYLLAYFALCWELASDMSLYFPLFLGVVSVMSRASSGIASLAFPTSKGGGLLDTFRDAGNRVSFFVCLCWLLLGAAVIIWVTAFGAYALSIAASIVSVLLCMLYVRVMSKRQFGGMSGDLAGFLLQLTELVALAAFVILGKWVF